MQTMKAAVYMGPRQMECHDVPLPEIGPKDLLVKVMSVGICGSDLHRYLGELPLAVGGIMGHEYSGVVVDMGKDVADYAVGDRIVVNGLVPCHKCQMCRLGFPNLCSHLAPGSTGAYAQYTRVNTDAQIIKFSEKVPFEIAQFAEPLSVATRTVRKAKIDFNDIVVIEGAGAIGLLTLSVARTLPVKMIIQTDVAENRLAIAKKLGADYTINTAGMSGEEVLDAVAAIPGVGKDRHGSYHISPNVDVVLETAGAPVTTELAFRMARGGGRIVLTAYVGKPVTLNPNILPQKEISIESVFAYVNEYPQTMMLMESGKLNLKEIITHHYPLEKCQEAFEMQMNREQSVKVVFDAAS